MTFNFLNCIFEVKRFILYLEITFVLQFLFTNIPFFPSYLQMFQILPQHLQARRVSKLILNSPYKHQLDIVRNIAVTMADFGVLLSGLERESTGT